jgi:hypothetical protein
VIKLDAKTGERSSSARRLIMRVRWWKTTRLGPQLSRRWKARPPSIW